MGIVSSYLALFAIVVVVVFTLLDAYACYSHGKFDGNIRIANIDLTSTDDVDLTRLPMPGYNPVYILCVLM